MRSMLDSRPLFYAGIGSRRTPPDMLEVMRDAAAALGRLGYVLRSGGADGADLAFEAGAGGAAEIFVPWRGFNEAGDRALVFDAMPGRANAMEIASGLHPRWPGLKPPVRKLMARNVMQVLGRACDDPVRFVLCWAPKPVLDADGRVADVDGGTGLAVRVAYRAKIPVYHLGQPEHRARVMAMIARDLEGQAVRQSS